MSTFDYKSFLASKNLCLNNYNLFSGPQGSQGAIGATGPKGVQGATGPQGAQGAQGACCVGAQGATGPQGAQGSPSGILGLQGPIGHPGQGNAINEIYSEYLNLNNDFSNPSAQFNINLPGAGGKWALSWSISESGFSDNSNNFCVTFTDLNNREFQPAIFNKNSPFSLNTNGANTSGAANDLIDFSYSNDLTFTVNIYQSSNLYSGNHISFNISISLISL
uniref:Collagen-like protein n=1 Tax=viral metagenome TaxID=1070528 RepID=A0A6C0KP35_9ZZZZ